MSDFEEQVGATLAAVAEDAPDAGGLVAGARRRHRVRRQRRIAAGGVAAALVVAVSAVALVAHGGEDQMAKDPTDSSSGEWQTIRQGDVVASVPPTWRRYECEGSTIPIHAPVDPCDSWTGAAFYGSATYDAAMGPGVVVGTDGTRHGYVYAGEFVLAVADEAGDLVRRILATARQEGQPVVDGSVWVSFERAGLTYEVPAWWGRGESGDRSGYSVCLAPVEGAGESSSDQVDPTHFVMREVSGPEGTVVVTAPTRAVAELVMATVEVGPDAAPAECTEEDFNVGLLPPEGSAGEPVEGEESVDASVADRARSFAADLEERFGTEGDYPIDQSTVESLIADGELAPLPAGHRLSTYFRLTRQSGFLFCLVEEVTGDYAAYDSTLGGVVGEGTADPGRDRAVDDACIAAINNA